jgi:hypothetical protein
MSGITPVALAATECSDRNRAVNDNKSVWNAEGDPT